MALPATECLGTGARLVLAASAFPPHASPPQAPRILGLQEIVWVNFDDFAH